MITDHSWRYDGETTTRVGSVDKLWTCTRCGCTKTENTITTATETVVRWLYRDPERYFTGVLPKCGDGMDPAPE